MSLSRRKLTSKNGRSFGGNYTSKAPEKDGDNKDLCQQVLTARENQILLLVADGLGNKDIADHLSLSRYTVECHIKHIYRKLAVSSRTRAIHAARERGLLK